MIKYKILNNIDEKGRLMGLPQFYECTSGCQHDSNELSYLGARKHLVEMGDEMGLDKMSRKKLIRGEDWQKLEDLTDELFENMDSVSRDELAVALVPYQDGGFNTTKYDLHIQTFDNGDYVSRDNIVERYGKDRAF